MELRHLRYFVVLAEELHFGRAASRLAITQPPLSFNIKQLEDELGVILLDRDNKRVALTQAGKAFYEEASAILSKADRAKQLARAIDTGKVGRLDVGFSASMIYMFLPAITQRYRDLWHDVDLVLHEMGLPAQVAALEHGQLDLGFVDCARIPEDFEGIRLREEAYVCCVAESHRLADADVIELSELANEAFVSFDRQGAPMNYDRVAAMCVAAGFTPRTSHAVRQWLTIIGLVSHDFGVALVPERMAQTGLRGVRFIPLISPNAATSTGHLLWNPKRMSDRMLRFIDTAREIVAASEAPVDA